MARRRSLESLVARGGHLLFGRVRRPGLRRPESTRTRVLCRSARRGCRGGPAAAWWRILAAARAAAASAGSRDRPRRQYRKGAVRFSPRSLSPGLAVLGLLENTVLRASTAPVFLVSPAPSCRRAQLPSRVRVTRPTTSSACLLDQGQQTVPWARKPWRPWAAGAPLWVSGKLLSVGENSPDDSTEDVFVDCSAGLDADLPFLTIDHQTGVNNMHPKARQDDLLMEEVASTNWSSTYPACGARPFLEPHRGPGLWRQARRAEVDLRSHGPAACRGARSNCR